MKVFECRAWNGYECCQITEKGCSLEATEFTRRVTSLRGVALRFQQKATIGEPGCSHFTMWASQNKLCREWTWKCAACRQLMLNGDPTRIGWRSNYEDFCESPCWQMCGLLQEAYPLWCNTRHDMWGKNMEERKWTTTFTDDFDQTLLVGFMCLQTKTWKIFAFLVIRCIYNLTTRPEEVQLVCQLVLKYIDHASD